MNRYIFSVILCVLIFFAGFGIIPATAGAPGEVAYAYSTATLNLTALSEGGNNSVSSIPLLGNQSGENPSLIKEVISERSYPDYVPGSVLVVYETGNQITACDAFESAALGANAAIGATVTEEFTDGVLPGCQVISLPDGMTVDEAVTYYEGQPSVKYAEPNYIRSIDTVPNDPYYPLQWGLQNTGRATPQFPSGGTIDADISVEDAWDTTTGSEDIVIAVIDSGVDYLHADLKANMWDDGSGHCGYDYVNNDNDPMDDNGHGTHCAGIIAAAGNNGLGVSGVCWDAKIMALKFLDSEARGSSSNEIKAINYAVANGADILSCSFGSTDYSMTEKLAIDNSGLLVVCAAGNDGTDNDATPHYPSSYISPNILSVASTAPDDSRSSFSNYGATSVDVGAPGTDIYSTLPGGEASIGTTRYSDDFSSLDGWEISDVSVTGQIPWHLDTTTYTSAPSAVTTGPYGNNWQQWLVKTDNISLAGLTNPVLRYQWWVDTQINSDWAFMGVSGEGLGNSFVGLSGNTGGFVEQTFDLTNFGYNHLDFTGKDITICYLLLGNTSTTGRGVWVDDIQIGQLDGPMTPVYGYMSGTSMATPMVSGVAGLLLAKNSSYTPIDLKTAIMENTDSIPALSGKCVSGGRVNVSAAMGPAPAPPIGSPSISGITPSTGLDSGLTYITALTGTNFTDNMSVQLTRTGETMIPAEYVYTEDITHARCAFNSAGAAAGVWDVSVTTVAGTATLPAGFTISADTSATDTLIIPVKSGWNMISAPRQGSALDLTNTTPNSLYCYDPLQGRYVSCSAADVIPGRGYWVSAPSTTDISATGHICPTYQYNVHAGWNLIGSIQKPVATGDVTFVPASLSLAGDVYAYDSGTGQYTETLSLTPGQAYWMAFSGDGVMIVA